VASDFHPCVKDKSFLVLFFKKEQRFFLEKEAKTFHPLAMSAMVQTAGWRGRGR
jgi:hypothetical protein